MATDLPLLGVGLGYRAPYRADVFQHRNQLGFLEIIADHYLDPTWEQLAELELLAAHFTLIPHAIGLSLGSADGIDDVYARQLAVLVRRLSPPWWSEHLAFTRIGDLDIGHLTPLPRTGEAIDVVARNVARIQQFIDVPLIIENSATLFEPPGELDEAAFINAVVTATDCGLLLDVANLHANAVNHGHDARAVLAGIPLDRVVQVHVAGGHHHHGVLVDSHAHPPSVPVWDLLREVLERAPVRGVILERDARLPPFTELLAEIDQARTLWDAARLHIRATAP